MPRVRITVEHNPHDPADDLRYASRVRRDLWSHSPVEVDPDSPAHGTHRDARRNAYFEFRTDFLPEVERVLRDYGHEPRARLDVVEEAGPECINCGNVAGPVLPAECPNCGFREIEPCPYCGEDIPRQLYERVAADLYRCPNPGCRRRVRLHLHDPLFDEDGFYNQPVVIVEPAEEMPNAVR